MRRGPQPIVLPLENVFVYSYDTMKENINLKEIKIKVWNNKIETRMLT
jgi:hypothetical protein